MSFPNRIPSETEFSGTINDISVIWAPNATDNLDGNAVQYKVDKSALKGATEHVAYACATRLEKKSIRIMGSFHNTTTVTATGEKKNDLTHCTVKVSPGQLMVQIYVELPTGNLDGLRVLAESVPGGGNTWDPNLSITYQ